MDSNPLESRLEAILEGKRDSSSADAVVLPDRKKNVKSYECHKLLSQIASEVRMPAARYEIDFDITILPQGCLVIDPGTEIYFGEKGGIISYGELRAVGTDEQRIRFLPSGTGWQNITIAGHLADKTVLDNCNIEGGNGRCHIPKTDTFEGIAFGEALPVSTGSDKPVGGGLMIFASDPEIIRCIIQHNKAFSGGGIISVGKSSPKIIECSIRDNYAEYGGAMTISYGDAKVISTVIENNMTHNVIQRKSTIDFYPIFTPEGLDVDSSTCIVQNNKEGRQELVKICSGRGWVSMKTYPKVEYQKMPSKEENDIPFGFAGPFSGFGGSSRPFSYSEGLGGIGGGGSSSVDDLLSKYRIPEVKMPRFDEPEEMLGEMPGAIMPGRRIDDCYNTGKGVLNVRTTFGDKSDAEDASIVIRGQDGTEYSTQPEDTFGNGKFQSMDGLKPGTYDVTFRSKGSEQTRRVVIGEDCVSDVEFHTSRRSFWDQFKDEPESPKPRASNNTKTGDGVLDIGVKYKRKGDAQASSVEIIGEDGITYSTQPTPFGSKTDCRSFEKLPAGNYTVTLKGEGVEKSRKVTIGDGHASRINFDDAKSKSDCFVATAVYCDANASQVCALRDFRDNVLMEYRLGRKAVDLYYSGFGERVANFIREDIPSVIPLIRIGLDCLVKRYQASKSIT